MILKIKEYTEDQNVTHFIFLFYQGELINNIEKNVRSAVEYVDESKSETHKAVGYKENRFKIASVPKFFKPFKRQTSAKTATDTNTSEVKP